MQKLKLFITALSLVTTLGCATEERIRTYGVAEISNDAIVSGRIVEERSGNGQKKVVHKQRIHEKVPCVGEDGQSINAKTVAECMKRKGKIVDDSFLENSGIKNK